MSGKNPNLKNVQSYTVLITARKRLRIVPVAILFCICSSIVVSILSCSRQSTENKKEVDKQTLNESPKKQPIIVKHGKKKTNDIPDPENFSMERVISNLEGMESKGSLLNKIETGSTNITYEMVWNFYHDNKYNIKGASGRRFIFDLWSACEHKGGEYYKIFAWFCEIAEEKLYELLGERKAIALQARAYLDGGLPKKTLSLLPKLKRPEKTNYTSDYDYAAYHWDMMEYNKAMKCLAQATGSIEKRVKYFLEAACVDPNGYAMSDCIYHAAEVYYYNGFPEKAIPLLEKYMSLDAVMLSSTPKYNIDGSINRLSPQKNVDFIKNQARKMLAKCKEKCK